MHQRPEYRGALNKPSSKSLLASRLRPVSSKATHPPTYLPLQSIANNSGYRYRLFHSRTKSASLDSHMYVSGLAPVLSWA